MSLWRCAVGLVGAFVLAVLLSRPVLRLTRRLRVGQPILRYVSEHRAKQGTPTMGGWIFILPMAVCTLALATPMGAGYMTVFVVLAYAIVGFLDDFLKIKRADNEGLKPYQKIVAQLGIAAVVCFYVYRQPTVGSMLHVPFGAALWDVGWWILPLTAFVYLAGTNSVNLTDGLDGLAASTTAVCCLGCALVAVLTGVADPSTASAQAQVALPACCLLGGLLGFLLQNVSPARIFMGDTGSMALGGAVCCLTVFGRNTLYLPILGITYVLTSISVIVQVGYFKISKGKRLFAMAPFHHHLQRKGWSESRVCSLYVAISCIAAVIAVMGVYVGYGMGR